MGWGYWEHLGRLDDAGYRNHRETKKLWYDRHFPSVLLITQESPDLSTDANRLIEQHFRTIDICQLAC